MYSICSVSKLGDGYIMCFTINAAPTHIYTQHFIAVNTNKGAICLDTRQADAKTIKMSGYTHLTENGKYAFET